MSVYALRISLTSTVAKKLKRKLNDNDNNNTNNNKRDVEEKEKERNKRNRIESNTFHLSNGTRKKKSVVFGIKYGQISIQ